ncbi:MAG: ABC transporter substrate-binding protein [Deltaproteobacteria bacterium]|nr:ABC transporter substrate-binding protein [Deltaproteobacteria bacterium]
MQTSKKWFSILCVAVVSGVAAPVATVQAADQFVPVPIYRTGPYAAGGTGIFGGMMDYMHMINERDGGVNGVKLTWEECETEYKVDRGVECYERLKNKPPTGAAMFHPLSTGITYATIERGAADKIPIVSMGYGRADASDGRVFPYTFTMPINYWNQNTAKIKFIGTKVGGMDKLKGLKIANVHHDSAYGKETIPILEAQAKKYGFHVKHYAVAHPGLEQKAIWLQIRQDKPDWIILRGWGVMNPTALKEAARVGFPSNKIVGVWWSGSEEDVRPAGDSAKGYIAAGFHPAGTDFPVIQEIMKHVQNKGKGHVEKDRVGTMYYNRGVLHGIVTVEAIRTAQKKYGNKPLTGEQVQFGLEHLKIDEARIKALGATALMSPIHTDCRDHEGGGMVKFQEWNGQKWVTITDWIKPDFALTRPLIEESAAKYAQEKGIKPRTCK